MSRRAVALLLMVGPTALLIVSIIGYALVNFLFSMTTASSDTLFAQPSTLQMLINVLLFVVGAIVVMTWLPGLVIGTVLLVTKKKGTHDKN